MNGVLILAHGSRAKETQQTLNNIVNMVKEIMPGVLIEPAYMEFGDVNICAGLEKIIAQGATDIKVVPYFLFDGIHIKEDIPQELAAFKEKHPDIKISLGSTLGSDRRLAEIIVDRINGK